MFFGASAGWVLLLVFFPSGVLGFWGVPRLRARGTAGHSLLFRLCAHYQYHTRENLSRVEMNGRRGPAALDRTSRVWFLGSAPRRKGQHEMKRRTTNEERST